MLKICGNYYISHIPAYYHLDSYIHIKHYHCVNYIDCQVCYFLYFSLHWWEIRGYRLEH